MSLDRVTIASPAALEQLALALVAVRAPLERQGVPEAPELIDARHFIAEIRSAGGEVWLVGERPTRSNVRDVRLEADTGRTCPDDLGDDELLNHHQVAEITGVTPRTVRRWIANGDLRHERGTPARKVRRSELDRFLAGRRS